MRNISCPCVRCGNRRIPVSYDEVRYDLLKNGFLSTYSVWDFHGEKVVTDDSFAPPISQPVYDESSVPQEVKDILNEETEVEKIVASSNVQWGLEVSLDGSNSLPDGVNDYIYENEYGGDFGPIGPGKSLVSSGNEYEQARKWVIGSHPHFDDWKSRHNDFLKCCKTAGKRKLGHVRVAFTELDDMDFHDMVRGPLAFVTRYNKYYVNGFLFVTKDYEATKVNQNSKVSTTCVTTFRSISKDKDLTDESATNYGILRDIVELEYREGCKPVLFKCDWVKVTKGVKVNEEAKLKLVKLLNFTSSDQVGDEPFIPAEYAKQVFYSEDPLIPDWHLVLETPANIYVEDEISLMSEQPNLAVADLNPSNNEPIAEDKDSNTTTGNDILGSVGRAKKKRGPSRGPASLPDGRKINVSVNHLGQPNGVDEETNAFVSNVGVLPRTDIPIIYDDILLVPSYFTNRILEKLEEGYEMSLVSDDYLKKKIASSWRLNKSRLRTKYITGHATADVKARPTPLLVPDDDCHMFVNICNFAKHMGKIMAIERLEPHLKFTSVDDSLVKKTSQIRSSSSSEPSVGPCQHPSQPEECGVARGEVVTVDPDTLIHNFLLSDGFYKILLSKVMKPRTPLSKNDGYSEDLGDVGEGAYIAWAKWCLKKLVMLYLIEEVEKKIGDFERQVRFWRYAGGSHYALCHGYWMLLFMLPFEGIIMSSMAKRRGKYFVHH
ncbi:hypothetical protein GIB67_032142, partial [Kingdonia uniflora]